jgi:hypothetical protein
MVMGAWGVALRRQSRRLAANAGVTVEEALKEWTRQFDPGRHRYPLRGYGALIGRKKQVVPIAREAEVSRDLDGAAGHLSNRRTRSAEGPG